MLDIMIIISDPWNFLAENGTLEMRGTANSVSKCEVCVALSRSFVSTGIEFDHVRVSPRHEGGDLSLLSQAGKAIPVNVHFFGEGAKDWAGAFLIGSAKNALACP